MSEKALSINVLKEAFFSMKINKNKADDKVRFNVIKNCSGKLRKPIMYLFNLFFQTSIFSDSLKIAKGTPLFKTGDPETAGNYRSISVLPCVSKMLEGVIYNRVYKCLTENNFCYLKSNSFSKVVIQSIMPSSAG